MNKVDPCSIIDHSQKTKVDLCLSEMSYEVWQGIAQLGKQKNDDATVGPRSSIQTAQKGTNPNHVNKGAKVEHGGNYLIVGH